ncbi:MAG: RNA polymerase sigma factor [Anaerolineae bacterium]
MSVFATGKSNLPDQDLVQQAQAGDLPAFNVLVLRYQTLAYNIAYRLIGNGDAAADATQEAFILAYRKIGQFRGGSFRAWLARIATNCAFDSLRSKKRSRTSSIDEIAEDEERSPTLISGAQSPEQHALAAELSQAISRAVQVLPPDQRAIVVLIDLNGLDYHEAAVALGISLGTVKSRLSRARAKVREQLLAHPELLPASLRL